MSVWKDRQTDEMCLESDVTMYIKGLFSVAIALRLVGLPRRISCSQGLVGHLQTALRCRRLSHCGPYQLHHHNFHF